LIPVAIVTGVGALAWWSLALASSPAPDDHDDAMAASALDAGRLEARLLLHAGRADWLENRVDEAQAAFERAAHLAGARGDDRISAEAAVMLVDLFGRRRSLFDEARRWESHARAAIARLGDPDLSAFLDLRWGTILALAGDADAGRALLLDLRERVLSDPQITRVASVDVESALARVETQAGRSVEALRWARLAVDGQAARVGTEHEDYAMALVRLGAAQEQRADLPGARRSLEAALAIHQRSGDEAQLFGVHNSLAIVLERQGDFTGAAREYDLALRSATELRLDDALASTRVNLGALALARRDADAALVHFTIARTLAEGIYPADHRIFIAILYGLGVARGRKGDAERAVVDLERALELAIALRMDTAEIGKHRYVLGQTRWLLARPGARTIARADVERGRAELGADPDAYPTEIAEADAWLESHRLDDGRGRP
jgi:tetratricopeptide (TPR) repeat protein